jgi:hypothetical protein
MALSDGSDQLAQIPGQIGGEEVRIDATQLLSQVFPNRIPENNGSGGPEPGTSYEEEMCSARLGIKLQAWGKLT